MKLSTNWLCEKWDEDVVSFARKRMYLPIDAQVGSHTLRRFAAPDSSELIVGNLGLNEGIQRLLALLTGAGGTAYNAANAYLGVGDSATAESATQTDLQAASNKFYKAMNATYPSTAAQTTSFQADFTSAEANYHWQEWSVAAGATSASGSGFTVGTTNLNRKVADLGTKTTGTWTLTAQITVA